MDWSKEFPKERFCELISSGFTDEESLENINLERSLEDKTPFHEAILISIQVHDQEFKEEVEEARKRRANVWFNGIIKSTRKDIGKEEVPAEKLKFEQRKYLASIDNPERYSEKVRHDHDVKINIFQEMKDLKAKDVDAMIAAHDPFVVETTATVIEDVTNENNDCANDLEELLK